MQIDHWVLTYFFCCIAPSNIRRFVHSHLEKLKQKIDPRRPNHGYLPRTKSTAFYADPNHSTTLFSACPCGAATLIRLFLTPTKSILLTPVMPGPPGPVLFVSKQLLVAVESNFRNGDMAPMSMREITNYGTVCPSLKDPFPL